MEQIVLVLIMINNRDYCPCCGLFNSFVFEFELISHGLIKEYKESNASCSASMSYPKETVIPAYEVPK